MGLFGASESQQFFDGRMQAMFGQKDILECSGEGNGTVKAGASHDGCIQPTEAVFSDPGSDLSAEASGEGVFVEHKRTAGPAYRGLNGFAVPGEQGPQINDIDVGWACAYCSAQITPMP